MDALTGLLNRRALDTRPRQRWTWPWRSKQPLSIVLCDVDFFKRWQRQPPGHGAGDACPKQVANVFPAGLPPAQRLCGALRGGEEFALILPNTPTPGAWVVVDALRAALDAAAAAPRLHRGLLHVTLSGGLHHRARQPDHTHRGAGARRPGPLRSQALGRNRIVMVGGYEGLDGGLAPAA